MPARSFAISSVAADGSSPFGMGGGVSVIMPLAQCVRRPRLRRLQRQRRPQRASRIRGGCFCSGGSYGACAVMELSVLTHMPPVPLGLLVPGGAGRLGLVRLSGCSYRSVSGQAEGGTGGGLVSGLVPGLVLPRRHPGVQDGRGVPRSEVSSGPLPADVTELCVSAVLPFFSAGAEKREGCLVLKHNRHCLAGILGGNTPKMTIPPEMTIIFNTAGFLQPRSYPLPPGLTVRRGCPRLMGVSLPLCRRASGCCIVRLWRVVANSRTPVVAARRGSGRLFGRFSVVGFRR